jgi:hypothetical protein
MTEVEIAKRRAFLHWQAACLLRDEADRCDAEADRHEREAQKLEAATGGHE